LAKLAARIKAKNAAVLLPDHGQRADAARAIVEGLELGNYRFDRYRTTQPEEKNAPRLEKTSLVLPAGENRTPAVTEAIALGQRVAQATNWARDLVNEPAGTLTPTRLAEAAEEAAKEAGLVAEISGRKEITKLNMGMFLGVAQGSAEAPRLIHLAYEPKDASQAKRKPLALVGKAITFDSGGLSLKTAEGMVDMKTDMAGSAAVFGAMKVIGALAPPFPVHAFVGACENMPSGTAYRPGDVLVSRAGKTVEITNTDAEGRLVLGDILSWANDWKPAALIDLATLTGACMVALGNYITGAFGENEPLIQEVLDAGKAAGEELWRMPVSDLQRDALRSEIADMKNSGERWGGAINAALFLREFVGDTPWVHLDIAGPSQSPKERGYYSKGATGVGVRTLVEWVRRRAV
jgi:leucyl aminopeptidase